MKPTKESILAAIVLLIEGYKAKTLGHLIHSCPLCKLFYNDLGMAQSTKECGKCPNVTFAAYDYSRGCIERGNLVSTLDFDYGSNAANLAEFWTRIHKLYQDTTEEDILELPESLQEDIRMIALDFEKLTKDESDEED